MLKFECKELGTNYSYVAQGDTLDEVKKSTMLHAQIAHKDWLAKKIPVADCRFGQDLNTHDSLAMTHWGKLA